MMRSRSKGSTRLSCARILLKKGSVGTEISVPTPTGIRSYQRISIIAPGEMIPTDQYEMIVLDVIVLKIGK